MPTKVKGTTGVDKIEAGAVITNPEFSGNATVTGTLTVNSTASINGSNISTQPSFRNIIINGNMLVNQRSGTITVNNAGNNYGIDRWHGRGTASDGVFTTVQDTEAPTGFTNSAKITVTTADASIGTSERYEYRQRIEGYNIEDLAWGTANAKTVTLSFWVRSSVTGTFGGSFTNGAGNRSYVFSYTITSANTWEQKTITVAGDTTGTWLTTNGIGIGLAFSLGHGSDYVQNAGSWYPSYEAAVTGQTNLIATNAATWYLTGVQLEVGSGASDFEHLPYDIQLARCQRYAYKLGGEISNYYADSAGGYWDANYIGFGKIRFPVPMRTAPSATFTAGGGINVWRGNTTYTGFSWNITISGNPTTRDCFIVGNKTSHGVTVDAGAMIKFEDTAANCLFSAEL